MGSSNVKVFFNTKAIRPWLLRIFGFSFGGECLRLHEGSFWIPILNVFGWWKIYMASIGNVGLGS